MQNSQHQLLNASCNKNKRENTLVKTKKHASIRTNVTNSIGSHNHHVNNKKKKTPKTSTTNMIVTTIKTEERESWQGFRNFSFISGRVDASASYPKRYIIQSKSETATTDRLARHSLISASIGRFSRPNDLMDNL